MTTTGNEAREALESVIAARQAWASGHWGTERVDRDAWRAIAAAIIAAGWKSPAEVERAKAEALLDAADVSDDEATQLERKAPAGCVAFAQRDRAIWLRDRADANQEEL